VRTEENDEILPWVKFRKEYYLALVELPDEEYILLSKAHFSSIPNSLITNSTGLKFFKIFFFFLTVFDFSIPPFYFYINSGYKGFNTTYFTNHEQQKVAEEVVLEEKKIDLKKQNIDFYVKKAMVFARKNGLPTHLQGRASFLTQEYISDFYVEYGIFFNLCHKVIS
jgi:hypothetical protein